MESTRARAALQGRLQAALPRWPTPAIWIEIQEGARTLATGTRRLFEPPQVVGCRSTMFPRRSKLLRLRREKLRQRSRCCHENDINGKFARCTRPLRIHVDHAYIAELIPVSIRAAAQTIVQFEGQDSCLMYGNNLCLFRTAIVISVNPESETGKSNIGGGDLSIPIVVERRQGQKAIRFFDDWLRRGCTEQLAAVVNSAVIVSAQEQKGVV